MQFKRLQDVTGGMTVTHKTTTLMISLLLATGGLAVSSAAVAGNTAARMEAAGYTCFNAGPSNWVHCMRVEMLGGQAVSAKVFSADGQEFLGTEQLLREDVYAGQPCPEDGINSWEWLGTPPYYACHHFYTGHNQ